MVDIPGLTFQNIVSYIFFPLAFIMGSSDLEDPVARNLEVLKVSELMGIKTFLNEFIAYEKLGELVRCCQISPRAELIATYTLCGFSNPGSVGISIAAMTSLCPSKKHVFTRVAMRAFIAGCVACFMTACVAGILTKTNTSCAGFDRGSSVFNCTAVFGPGGNKCS